MIVTFRSVKKGVYLVCDNNKQVSNDVSLYFSKIRENHFFDIQRNESQNHTNKTFAITVKSR